MPVPSVDDLTLPLLEELADGRERSTRELWERLVLRFALNATDLAGRSADGRHLFGARVRAARERLRERGWLECLPGFHWRITETGIEALHEAGELAATPLPAGPVHTSPHIGPGPFESEVRSLLGDVARRGGDWTALSLLNGWNIEGIMSFAEVARLTGRSTEALRDLERLSHRSADIEAPAIDATLEFARSNSWRDAKELAFHLAQLGLVWTPMSPAGICEAARRFGREEQWRDLVRALATSRGKSGTNDTRLLPRPFESWLEVEVFLFLEDLGCRPLPLEHAGAYDADIVVVDLRTPLLVKCEGEAWRRGDRAGWEAEAVQSGVAHRESTAPSDSISQPAPESTAKPRVVRVSDAEWRSHTRRIQGGLRAMVDELGPLSSVG